MKSRSVWKRYALTALGALALWGALSPLAQATDLPPGVLTYLRQKDPHVKVRFDGLVLFSNGESYVPVIPQDPSLSPDSQQVIATMPEKVNYPDLIQFDNNFFLMRLIQTSTGRLTFPKMANYPLQLKEGLLPQDLVMPNNLFIPVELKVILGALPYNPSYSPQPAQSVVPLAVTLNSGQAGAQFKTTSRQTYVFDLNDQKILGIDPITGSKTADVALDCAPSSLKLSPDGKLLFVPCLASNELVVIDTGSNLVKTRIPVGQRPESVVYVYPTNDVVISNRYSSFLSVIGSEELVSGDAIPLPEGASGGPMALIPGEKLPKLVVADAFKPVLYLVDVLNKRVEKSWQALPEISSILVLKNDKGLPEYWVASRTESKLMVLDDQGRPLKTLDVGSKPVDLVAFDKKVFVLSAGDSQLQLIDAKEKTVLETTPLEADGFPSGIVTVPSEKLAYVSMAASRSLLVLNLTTGKLERTLPVEFRASMIGMTPDKLDAEQFPAIAPADLPPAKPAETPVAIETKKPAANNKPKKEQAKTESPVTEAAKPPSGSVNTVTLSGQTPEAATVKPASVPVSTVAKSLSVKQDSKLKPETDTGRIVYPCPQSGVIATPGANGGKFRLNVIKLGRSGHDRKAVPKSAEDPAASVEPANAKSAKKADALEPANVQAGQKTHASVQNNDNSAKNTDMAPPGKTKVNGKDKPAPKPTEPKQAKADTKSSAQVVPVGEDDLPAKAGARIEQKPLALPAESILPPATGQAFNGKQEPLPLKDDKIKSDKIE